MVGITEMIMSNSLFLDYGMFWINYMSKSVFDAGYIYCPYIPLFIEPYIPYRCLSEEDKLKRRNGRKEYLMKCPSFPYNCTGHCSTSEFEKEIDGLVSKEFGHE